jgi:ATP-dependent Clp protease ATP-binding subunit ClpB
MRKRCLEALRQTFRPEFLNRVDEIVIFDPLGKEELERIIEIQLGQLRKLVAERRVEIELTPAARQLLYREGYDPQFGARPLKRAIQRLVQDPLAMKILNGEILPGDRVLVDADLSKGEMKFERARAEVAAK